MFALILIIVSLCGGILMTYFYDEKCTLPTRIVEGSFIGITFWGLVGFATASLVGDLPLWVPMSSAVLTFGMPVIFLLPKKMVIKKQIHELIVCVSQKALRPNKLDIFSVAFYIGLFVFFHFISQSAFFMMNGEYYTRYGDNYSDATLHTGITAGFAYGQNYPPIHPDYAGSKLSYPFLINFIAAMFVNTGMDIETAFYFQYMLHFFLMTWLIKRMTFSLTKNISASFIVPLLIYFSGGLGFSIFFKELLAAPDKWDFLLHLPHEYTNYNELLRWGNAIINWFVPMRSLILGVPLALLVVSIWWRYLTNYPNDRRLLLGTGVIAGLLPLVHTHSYLVVVGASILWSALFRKWKMWLYFGLPAFSMGLPQMMWIRSGSGADFMTFFGFMNGWMRGEYNFVWYWLVNTGFFIPLLLLSFCVRGLLSTTLRNFLFPFLILFVVGNFVRVTPWDWDNNKILMYWFMLSCIPVALLIARLWRNGWGGKIVAFSAFIVLIWSGGLDLGRILLHVNNWIVFDRTTIAMAEEIKKLPADSVIVTAPYINHPILLSGRKTFMGYTGRLWTHGLSYVEREEIVNKIYEGDTTLLENYGIDYVLVSAAEDQWMMEKNSVVNRQTFEHLPIISQVEDKYLYQVQ